MACEGKEGQLGSDSCPVVARASAMIDDIGWDG